MKFDVSIIIPVYNGEKYLARCMDSIVSRNPERMEVILIDDGSLDATASICDNYCNKYDYISVYHIENRGVSSARNFGIKKAVGQYIFFLDADDYMADEWDKIFSIVLKENASDMMIFSHRVVGVNKNNLIVVSPFIEGQLSSVDVYKCLVTSSDTNACWGKLIKKDIILNNEILFKEKLKIGEDVDFQVELLRVLNNIYYFDKVVVEHFDNPESVMNKFKISMFSDLEESYNIRNKIISEVGLLDSRIINAMYTDLIRTLLSYIRKMCKKNTIKESRNIIQALHKEKYIIDILNNSKKKNIPVNRKVIVFMIEIKLYLILVVSLKVIS